MKFAAGILGIIGGAWLLVVSFGAIVVGVFLEAIFDISYITTLGSVTIIFSAIGIFGGVLAFAKPRIGGYCMLIGSVGAIILTVAVAVNGHASVHTILPMILLIGGGALALARGR